MNWELMNWPAILGAASSTKALGGNMDKFFSAQVLEKALEKYSCNQLQYVGDTSNGVDFKGIDGLRYELKSSYKIYQPRVSHTAWITMKNFRGHSTGISQTFDKLIAIDKTYNAVLLCDFDNLEMEETGAVVRCRLHSGLYNTIAQCKPKSKNIDVKKELNNLIESLI